MKNKPSRSKNSLFVLGKKVAANKKVKKVTALPDAGNIKPRPTSGWFEYSNFFFCVYEV